MKKNRSSIGVRGIAAMLLPLVVFASACGGGSDPAATDGPATSSDDSAVSGSSTAPGDTAAPSDGDDGDTAPSGDGSSLTIAVDWDVAPGGFDPLQYANEQFPFYSTVYDSLFVTGVDGQVAPSLVSEFEPNEDATQLTLTLNEGATFADGSPLNAEVVKANLDRRDDPALNLYQAFTEKGEAQIANVEATGDYVVTITFAHPVESPEQLLADTAGVIIGPAGLADAAALEAAPDGSGAYRLDPDRTTRGSAYAVVKNADYWNASAWSYDNINFDVIVDPQARANAALSGQADIAIDIDPTLIDMVRSEGSLAEIGGTMGAIPVFDKTGATHPAFAFVETRLAISYAIDRDKLVEALVPGGRPTSQMFPETAPGYDPALDDKYTYDPDKSRELLASVGFPDGFEQDITVLGAPTDLQLAVQAMLAEVGIKLNWVTATSTDQLFAAVRTQGIAISTWALGNAPAGFIAGPVTSGFMNQQGAQNEVINAALGPALGGDPEALKTLNAAVVDEGWWISLFESKFYIAYNSDTVTEPANAGTNNYLVVSAIKPA